MSKLLNDYDYYSNYHIIVIHIIVMMLPSLIYYLNKSSIL
uniref:Uncharacterized protein n=1 Tax=Anguilla anguilla TaxID=7936 RepID=A0A0E9RWQ7_ANGAN